jgi:hypothetical protein
MFFDLHFDYLLGDRPTPGSRVFLPMYVIGSSRLCTTSNLVTVLAYLYLGILAAEFQSILIAALIPSFVASLAIAAFINGFWMSVQGYFIRNLPKFWYYWAHFIDYEVCTANYPDAIYD